jgi:phosphoribosylglycinamide formyltransferase 1
MSDARRVAILLSGRGSNMIALVEALRARPGIAEPALVVSNVAEAPGIARARALGVETAVVDSRVVRPRAEHERRVLALLREHAIDLVCLAGYMRLLSPEFVSAFRGRILNVHPSLLPAFPGLDAQRQALAHGVRVSGCTVHFVDEACDTGPIVLQAAVPVLDTDTEETLAARILEQEHRIYPEAVALLAAGRLVVEDRRVRVLPPR